MHSGISTTAALGLPLSFSVGLGATRYVLFGAGAPQCVQSSRAESGVPGADFRSWAAGLVEEQRPNKPKDGVLLGLLLLVLASTASRHV